MPESQEGYVNFFEVLGLTEDAKTGEVRKVYRRRMKALVAEIARVEITEERRAHYLLEMAKFNAALCVLRDTPSRDTYWEERTFLIDLEAKWCAAAESGGETEDLRRQFDGRIRGFLAKYCDEMMLAAGSDKECVEASYWDAAHERHASRLLRHYRQSLYQKILARLPYSEVTPPKIDWDKRRHVVAAALKERTS